MYQSVVEAAVRTPSNIHRLIAHYTLYGNLENVSVTWKTTLIHYRDKDDKLNWKVRKHLIGGFEVMIYDRSFGKIDLTRDLFCAGHFLL